MDDCGYVVVTLCDWARLLLVGNFKKREREKERAGKHRREKFMKTENENRGTEKKKVLVHYVD